MNVVQMIKEHGQDWKFQSKEKLLTAPLVLVFGNRHQLESTSIYEEVKTLFPGGHIVFGSTSGEISGANVYDGSIVLMAIDFEKSKFEIAHENVRHYKNNFEKLGHELVKKLPQDRLKHILVISEGSSVNGSTLIKGMQSATRPDVGISGGLCGDDSRFEKTLASYNEAPQEGEVIAIGLYGDSLEITCANFGGWTAFGPKRTVTKSIGNVLYELDGKPALNLYKTYLGEKAKELPQAALLYPLNVREPGSEKAIVRTILNIDENENTMILAGDVPLGSSVELMMSTVDDIAEGASTAATYGMRNRRFEPELALLVSCVGRKLVMDQRTEEEVEEVIDVIGKEAKVIGFYSYGEIAPFSGGSECKLHNQTMTLTLVSE